MKELDPIYRLSEDDVLSVKLDRRLFPVVVKSSATALHSDVLDYDPKLLATMREIRDELCERLGDYGLQDAVKVVEL